jgi:hypothetical protein
MINASLDNFIKLNSCTIIELLPYEENDDKQRETYIKNDDAKHNVTLSDDDDDDDDHDDDDDSYITVDEYINNDGIFKYYDKHYFYYLHNFCCGKSLHGILYVTKKPQTTKLIIKHFEKNYYGIGSTDKLDKCDYLYFDNYDDFNVHGGLKLIIGSENIIFTKKNTYFMQ